MPDLSTLFNPMCWPLQKFSGIYIYNDSFTSEEPEKCTHLVLISAPFF